MRNLLPLISLLLAVLAWIAPAHGEIGCAAAEEMGDVAAADCTAILTFTTLVAGEAVEVTIVADSAVPGARAQAGQVRTAVERSAARLSAMSLSGFPDVTISLATAVADAPADTDGGAGMSGADCVVGLAAPALADAGLLQHTTAHELFHCAQYLLQPDLTDLASAAWWAEGSAEWFANWVIPGTAYSSGWVASFDRLSADAPVTAMDYPAVVFFAWYGQAHGPVSIADFIHGLTGSADDLAAAVGEDGWWQFVDAYFETAIRWPGGAALPSAPQRGPSFTFADSDNETLEADRYVLYRADVVFEAGWWTLENAVEAGRYDVGEGRQQLPDAIETGCDEPTRYRLHGSGISPDGFRLVVDATLEEESACEGCVEAPAFDRCLVGSWAFSAGGAAEWIRSQVPGVGIDIPSTGDPNMTFFRNGTYIAGFSGLQAIITLDEARGEGIEGAASAGRWSTSGATLHICEDELAFGGTVTIEHPEVPTMTVPLSGGPGTVLALDYACTADSLITELRFPGIPQPMVTNYTRVTPPPEP